MKQKKQTAPLVKPVLQVIVMILVLISAALSWFIFNNEVSLSQLDVNMKRATNVSISCDGGQEWSNNLIITQEGEGGSVPVTELSGNGANLYIPIVENKTVTGYYLPDLTQTKKSFIEFSVEVKADGPIQLFLGNESSITPLDLSANLSSYGNYSKNYIAGAVRVALFSDDNVPIIWAPNSTIEYSQSNNTVTYPGSVEDAYTYAIGENVTDIQSVSTGGHTSGISNDGRFVWGDLSGIDDFEKMQPVLEIDTPAGQVATKKLTVRLWIEGTDREAVLPLLGGRFKINLKFTSAALEK